jgi:hypothetical protein
MPSIFTLTGSGESETKPKRTRGLGDDEGTRCSCRKNPKTGRSVRVCFFEKGALLPSGERTKKRGMKITGLCP